MAPEERPREKMLAKGVKSLSNAELLAILLRTGNKNKNAIELAKLYNK
ncbi:DNA repair RadC domain protein [Clostridioides difficile DA00129]|nr:DNA repair RadC domain protein [Clostridioides difficile DA00129]